MLSGRLLCGQLLSGGMQRMPGTRARVRLPEIASGARRARVPSAHSPSFLSVRTDNLSTARCPARTRRNSCRLSKGRPPARGLPARARAARLCRPRRPRLKPRAQLRERLVDAKFTGPKLARCCILLQLFHRAP